jgi:arginine vasopressin receptor 1A
METASDSMTFNRVLDLDINSSDLLNEKVNNTNETIDSRNEELAIIEISILALLFITILIGNLFVLIALAVRKPKMNRMYYFLLHLCIADLITAFFNVLPQLLWDISYRFYGGNILCKLIKYLQILGPYLSSYILVITSIDRHQAICYPLSNCSWTPKRSQLMILIAWILSLVFCSPQLFIFSYQQIPGMVNIYDCWGIFPQPYGERIYVTWYAITVFIVPFIIILTAHICICREIFNNLHRKRENIEIVKNLNHYNYNLNTEFLSSSERSTSMTNFSLSSRSMTCTTRHSKSYIRHSQIGIRKNVRNSLSNISIKANDFRSTPRSHSLRSVSRAKIKTVKITVVIMVCYVLCSMPFISVQLWVYWYPSAQSFFQTSKK